MLAWLCYARQALPYRLAAVQHRLCCLLQVSVGRLGVITRVTFRVVPHGLIKRSRVDLSPETFAEHLLALEAKYVSALTAGDAGGVAEVTRQLEGTNVSRSRIQGQCSVHACAALLCGQCTGAWQSSGAWVLVHRWQHAEGCCHGLCSLPALAALASCSCKLGDCLPGKLLMKLMK